jgi:hypothetical protein
MFWNCEMYSVRSAREDTIVSPAKEMLHKKKASRRRRVVLRIVGEHTNLVARVIISHKWTTHSKSTDDSSTRWLIF